MRLRFYSSVLCSALLLAACNGSDSTAPVVDITSVNFASNLGITLSQMNKNADGLYLQDAPAGTGATAVRGNQVTVNYTGYYTNGTQFDSSIGKSPLVVTLGQGQVIAGFDEGITGMKVGGTRKLVIPPSLGYGATAHGSIPANSILVFTVTLLSTP